ncbi:CinA family nicotinamide mononucleotide deamidase-related protein [Proteiniphilum sp. X52]|uniref:CinA family nicotinamide mononucleotide deamidase-related protein n=1 Tax=Proteiniphilum sp. X52 TaxID=2382159 RepID=UPI000F09B243|nr:CinA family nicotinamide mononucleotide deamidase-related protein [Proteiniphilum sp. X52]RNC64524.1 CinA family nicotinamide mononucleotide deamidase-related protein [Proteiniphilum sp. X52]
MKVEVITIGDEILIGQIVDTNAAWLGRELTRYGFAITAITSVGDCQDDIIRAIDHAFERADILLLTGGAGPTNDDITKHTLCRYFHTALEFNEEVLQNIELLFLHRNIPLNQLTRQQAYIPQNCRVIQNRAGTAPILWFDKEGKVLVSMPGVPFEMRTAMGKDIIPLLQERFQANEYLQRSYLATGITESALATRLAVFENKLPAGFSLAYLPSFGYIRLRLSAWGEGRKPEMKQLGRKLKQLLGDHFAGKGEKMPEELLGEKLRKRQLTVATAESCTGGYIAHRITVVPGASDYYQGSIVSYDNRIKEEQLDVDPGTIDAHGVVSREVVEQMAINITGKLRTECGIAVSGIMGPDGGTKSKPVGTVWIATYCEGRILSREYNVGRSRKENIERAANLAILQLLKMLSRK